MSKTGQIFQSQPGSFSYFLKFTAEFTRSKRNELLLPHCCYKSDSHRVPYTLDLVPSKDCKMTMKDIKELSVIKD